MGPIVFHSHSAFRLPAFSFYLQAAEAGKLHLSRRDVPSCFRRTDLQFTLSCIGSDENRRGKPLKRSSASGRSTKKEENKKSPAGKKVDSSNQEEIIALFRRIQSSLSKEESTNALEINSKTSEDKLQTESILNVLRRSRNQAKGKVTNKEGGKVLTRRGVPEKKQGIQSDPPVTDFKLTRLPSKFAKASPIPFPTAPRGNPLALSSEALLFKDGTGIQSDPPVTDFKLTRLPSRFVKASPIPFPTAPRVNPLELSSEALLTRLPSKFVKASPIPFSTAPRGNPLELSSEALLFKDGTETDLPRLEKMKLPELKKLAKSRGIRGYSKLKKSELVNLLRS